LDSEVSSDQDGDGKLSFEEFKAVDCSQNRSDFLRKKMENHREASE